MANSLLPFVQAASTTIEWQNRAVHGRPEQPELLDIVNACKIITRVLEEINSWSLPGGPREMMRHQFQTSIVALLESMSREQLVGQGMVDFQLGGFVLAGQATGLATWCELYWTVWLPLPAWLEIIDLNPML